jgi:XTP/dITP diphosphohydrolase
VTVASVVEEGAAGALLETPALLEFVGVMDALRSDCPWDAEQTHRSLTKYLLEEAYEVIEAIENDDYDHLREELGDLLLQVYFHARIAAEDAERGFTIDDVARGIVDKLVYRHPHVFAGLEVADADEVGRNWEALKAAEKQRTSPIEGIPMALPSLLLADKVLSRLEKAGSPTPVQTDSGIGARLLDLVREARTQGLDAEQELRDAVRRLVEAGE